MNTQIIERNGSTYQQLFSTISVNEFTQLASNESLLLTKTYYDSRIEAENQGQLLDKQGKQMLVQVYACMTGTVLDILSSEDMMQVRLFFDSERAKIQRMYQGRSVSLKKMTLEDFTIRLFIRYNPDLKVIREMKRLPSDKHELFFVRNRGIVTYRITELSAFWPEILLGG